MKLSYRDKVIFICAIVILILIAGFFLFIKPKYEAMGVAKAALADKELEKAGIEEKINTLTSLVDQTKEAAKSIEEEQKRFIAHQDPYLMEKLVYEITEECGVEVESFNTSYVTPGTVNEYVVGNSNVTSYPLLMQSDLYNELPQKIIDHYNGVPKRTGDSVTIGLTTMTIKYKDDLQYSHVMDFINTIAEDERTIRVVSLSGDYSESGNRTETSGEIPLQIYSMSPLNVEKVMEETDQVEIVPVEEAAAEETAAE